MGLRETKTPDIPTVPDAKGALARFIQAVTETLQVREGRRGDQLDQAVTYRDLVAGGMVKMRGIGQVGGRTGGLAFTPVAGGDDPDLTPPPLLTGLKATPGLKTIFVQWDAPIYTQGHGPAHVEVWGAPYSGTGPLPTFGNATLLDRVQGVLYPHQVQHASTWHYWARNVTVDGVAQPTPTGGTNGVSATAGLDIEAALTDLTGQITESQLYDVLGSRINLIDGPDTLTGSVAYRIKAEADAREIAIQEEAVARADETGALFAQWTVKIDAAGRVSGIGLASEPSEAGGSTSAFGVRADRFWVAAPNDYTQEAAPGSPTAGQTWYQPSTKLTKRWDGAAWQAFEPIVPFTVQTTPLTESGRTLPAGVYMDAAYIRNVSALIARFGEASIEDALIADLDAAKLTAGDGTIGGVLKSVNYLAGSQGWRIHRDGSAEFGFAHIRGTLTADRIDGYDLRVMSGGYSAWAWPAAGQSGFYLGPEGLLLGNYNDGQYFQVTADGRVYAPGFSVESGIARLGTHSATSLTTDIAAAAGTATWSGVSGDGKPADYATAGAPTGTYVGNTLAQTVEGNAADGKAAHTAVTNATTGLATKLASNARNVLSGAGGFVAGDLTWDGNGNRTGGNGVAMTASGLVGYKAGVAQFAIGTDGSASFAGALNAATGTFAGAFTADALNAVNAINLGPNAVNASNFASGSAASISTSIVVPAGKTWRVLALGFQGTAEAVAPSNPYGTTLSLAGASTSVEVGQQDTSSGASYRWTARSATVASVVDVVGPATYAPVLSGASGVPKTIILFGAPA